MHGLDSTIHHTGALTLCVGLLSCMCPQALAKSGFINYYGMQRFGSYGEPTSAIGEEWICVTNVDHARGAARGIKRGSRLLTPPVVESAKGVAMLKRNWKAVVDYVMRPRLGEEQRVADVRTSIHVYNMYIYTWIFIHFEVGEKSVRQDSREWHNMSCHVLPVTRSPLRVMFLGSCVLPPYQGCQGRGTADAQLHEHRGIPCRRQNRPLWKHCIAA